MNSKQRVNAVFNGNNIDRYPMWYGGAPQTTDNLIKKLGAVNEQDAMKMLGIDFITVRPEYKGSNLKKYSNGSEDTIWGIRRGGEWYGQALNHPLKYAETVKAVETYSWPSKDLWDVKINDEILKKAQRYCVIGGMWAPFFHDVIELLGMENCFIKMFEKPEIVEAVIERVFDFYYDLSLKTFQSNPQVIDMFFFGNDFGAQKGLLCSPDMWRRFFKPSIKKLVELGHQFNTKAVLHSCGDIYEIIPDLIEIGIDGINPVQITAFGMNPEKLISEYGRDIVFFGGIDVNKVLTKGSEMEVRAETRRIIDILGSYGRYIVAPTHDYMLPDIPVCNIIAMYDEAKKYSAKIKCIQ